jgi:ABC-type multidrug transport system ATPase subunit
LDEATSSVDQQTDDRVQEIIREEFKECTVLAVAHRFQTIGNSDLVFVVDQGRVVDLGIRRSIERRSGHCLGCFGRADIGECGVFCYCGTKTTSRTGLNISRELRSTF